jgi:hypothetical protein
MTSEAVPRRCWWLLARRWKCCSAATRRSGGRWVQCANAAAVRVLLDAGADVHTLNGAGTGLVVTLLLAPSFASEPGLPARALMPVFELLAAKRDMLRCVMRHQPCATLPCAADTGREDCMKALLAAGADANDLTGVVQGQGALAMAVTCGFSKVDSRGPGADAAAADRSLRLVRTLLRAGADTRHRCDLGHMPIRGCALTGDARVAEAILAHEATKGLPPVETCARNEEEADWLRRLRAAVDAFRRGETGSALPAHLVKPLLFTVAEDRSFTVTGAQAVQAATAAAPVERCAAAQCAAAGRAVLKCCGACKRVKYCSDVCQRAHWREHKEACRAACAARA